MKFFSQKINIILLFLSMLMLSCSMADDIMMKTFTKRFNKKCPIVSGAISIDGAEIISKDTVGIYISFVYDMNDSEIYFQQQTLPTSMIVPLLQMVNEKQFKLMKKKQMNFLFSFFTNTGIHVVDIPISPEQYNLPIENFTSEGVDSLNTMGILHNTANSIKLQLPIENPENGLTIVDCYIEDSAIVSVNMIPNSFKEEVIDRIDRLSFKNLFCMELSQKPTIRNTISNGIKIKHIYTLQNGDTLITINLNKENIDDNFVKLIDTQTRIKYAIDISIHNINWQIKNQTEKTDEIYYIACHFKDNTFTTELRVPNELLESDYLDFEIIYDNILDASLSDELLTLFLLKKGITLEYIYKDEDDETLDTLLVTEKDVARYKKQKYDNNEILKY